MKETSRKSDSPLLSFLPSSATFQRAANSLAPYACSAYIYQRDRSGVCESHGDRQGGGGGTASNVGHATTVAAQPAMHAIRSAGAHSPGRIHRTTSTTPGVAERKKKKTRAIHANVRTRRCDLCYGVNRCPPTADRSQPIARVGRSTTWEDARLRLPCADPTKGFNLTPLSLSVRPSFCLCTCVSV